MTIDHDELRALAEEHQMHLCQETETAFHEAFTTDVVLALLDEIGVAVRCDGCDGTGMRGPADLECLSCEGTGFGWWMEAWRNADGLLRQEIMLLESEKAELQEQADFWRKVAKGEAECPE